ncbi:carboxylesterase family protein [Emericellopsis cladophorae]|uniref:Carboxylesterase family protein n=1 Tax=Emericellopsis cladophorae TaxID=2686198 RepID=A0A9P9XZQ6_9HYPO|nr:carboxylesterase family protein [Emericellopsis cladophorae]KAI6780879.1 carboxylesterase family protein [Emericellopsis cladophorae]
MMESSITNRSTHFSHGGTFRVPDDEGQYLDDSHAAALSDGKRNHEPTAEQASLQTQPNSRQSIATGRANELLKRKPPRLARERSSNDTDALELLLGYDEHRNHVRWNDEQTSSEYSHLTHKRESTSCTNATVTDIGSYIGIDTAAGLLIERQVNRLQHGDRFDWVIVTPASEQTAYGCNFVGRKTDSFYFVAAPLNEAQKLAHVNEELSMEDQVLSVLDRQQPARPAALRDMFTVPKIVEVTEGESSTLCPDESVAGSMMTLAADCGASSQRIEDSLEEIDQLEEQLEAMRLATSPRHQSGDQQDTASRNRLAEPAASKRVSIAPGQAATMRVKPSEKTRTSPRRVNSLTMRNQETSTEAQHKGSSANTLTRSKSTLTRLREPKVATGRPSKPATVPNFELPGEAVSRRLREQREAREARKARQAEAEKAAATPPKPRLNRMLPKPTFELPGEAISRRKREEREARFRAEEEEERKRREFKARPVRLSMASTTLPRNTTIASRARESRPSPDANSKDVHGKRLSTSVSLSRMSATTFATTTPGYRGRTSDAIAAAADATSRGTSVATNVSDKRSSVSQEDAAFQRARAREIWIRDNSYRHEREREKHEREVATKLARAQAAERSRAASREWAEKRRAKEQARLSIRA